MFLFLYGFFTIGLLIALFWIHRLPIHQAVKRARSVANILTLLYLMFYTIVLFPQFVRGFLLWGGDMMHDSSIGLILKMVANLFNFTLIPLFTWISSIHTRYTTSRIDALESGMPSQYGDLVPMLLKVDMVDTTSMVAVPELFDMGAWRSMETIPIKAIVLSVTDAIVSGRFVLPAEISGALMLAFMANYMDDVPGKLEELRTAMGIAELPGKSMRYIATVIMKIVRLGVNMTQLYKEIAPDETAFQMKIGGTVAGYMTGLGFVIAFIILAITG